MYGYLSYLKLCQEHEVTLKGTSLEPVNNKEVWFEEDKEILIWCVVLSNSYVCWTHVFHECDEVDFAKNFSTLQNVQPWSPRHLTDIGLAAILRLSASETCWIRFKSGKHAEHFIRCIVSVKRMFSTSRAVWGLALSYIKLKVYLMATT